jgi:hypothetical protein
VRDQSWRAGRGGWREGREEWRAGRRGWREGGGEWREKKDGVEGRKRVSNGREALGKKGIGEGEELGKGGIRERNGGRERN